MVRGTAVSAALTTAVVAGLLQLVAVIAAPAAWSCSCGGTPSDADYYRGADVVFTGTVTAREEVLPPRSDGIISTGDPIRLVSAVDRVYKGKVGAAAHVQSRRDSASCGVATSGAGPFLVFADKRADGLHAEMCGGTRPQPTSLPAVLGHGHPPPENAAPRSSTYPHRPAEHGAPPRKPEPPPDEPFDNTARAVTPWLAGGVAGLLLLALPGWLTFRALRASRAQT